MQVETLHFLTMRPTRPVERNVFFFILNKVNHSGEKKGRIPRQDTTKMYWIFIELLTPHPHKMVVFIFKQDIESGQTAINTRDILLQINFFALG